MATPFNGKRDFSPERKELLQRLLKQQGFKPSPLEEKRPVQHSDIRTAPLSFAQQRIWFLHHLDPSSSNYHMLSVLRLVGALDVKVLEASLNAIVSRHDILRTTFPVIDGKPMQEIAPTYRFSLVAENLCYLSVVERKEAVTRAAQTEKQHPFDLAQGPLFRVALFQLDEAEHVLLLSLHHILADAWSMGILSHELALFYNAFVNHEVPGIAPLTVQYADFAIWQKEWLQGDVLEGQLRYWTQQLRGAPPLLALPTDHPRQARQRYSSQFYPVHFSADLSQKINDFARQSGVTLVMVILAAFQILLCRYSGQEDITVGMPVANRSRTEFEALIGNFVNTIALRTRLHENPTIQDVLQQVRVNALDAYTRQDVPFEQVVEALHPERDSSRTVLFQVLFTLQNAYKEDELAGMICQPFE